MKSVLIRRALLGSVLASLAACGSPNKKPTSEVEAVDEKGSQKFSLAKFLRSSEAVGELSDAISTDDYLFFGDRSKFRLESNMTLDSQGESGLFFGGPRSIDAAFWLDGYVFGKRLGGSSAKQGYLVDLGATGELETTSLEAHVRFLGDDKYKGELEGAYDKSFVRDLDLEATYYPIPMLGVKVAGNIGGELGLRVELGVKTPSSMSMIFRPKTSLSAGLSGGIEVLKFAEAKVKGAVDLLSMDVASTANLGYLSEASYSYGHTGVDGGELRALDGKVEILANASAKGVLPGGIDAKLWEYALEAADLDSKWEWKHTVWNPKPVATKDLPAYGNSFMKFARIPSDHDDCLTKADMIAMTLDKHSALIEDHMADLDGMDVVMSKQSLTYLAEVKGRVKEDCRQF